MNSQSTMVLEMATFDTLMNSGQKVNYWRANERETAPPLSLCPKSAFCPPKREMTMRARFLLHLVNYREKVCQEGCNK